MDIVKSKAYNILTKIYSFTGLNYNLDPALSDDISDIFEEATQILSSQPSVLTLTGDFTIIGDIHGSISSLLRIFNENQEPPSRRYLLLGDYVDRGMNSIEVLACLSSYLVLYPKDFYLLRGNHEFPYITTQYGFQSECNNRNVPQLYYSALKLFDQMPICAILNDKFFCVHAGISPRINDRESLYSIQKPKTYFPKSELSFHPQHTDSSPEVSPPNSPPDEGFSITASQFSSLSPNNSSNINTNNSSNINTNDNSSKDFSKDFPQNSKDQFCQKHMGEVPPVVVDLLWSDPCKGLSGYIPSFRGAGFMFGEDALEDFLAKIHCAIVVRSHEHCPDGFKFTFDQKRILTIFSSINYCNMNNTSSYLNVVGDDAQLKQIKPMKQNQKCIITLPQDILAYQTDSIFQYLPL